MKLCMMTFCLVVMLMFLSGCGSPVYFLDGIEAQVVDKETGQPLPGVIVVAAWRLERGSLDGSRLIGHLAVKEAITDQEGSFSISGFFRVNAPTAGLRNGDPRLIFFKPDYYYKLVANSYPVAGTKTPGVFRKSPIKDGVVKLERYKGDYTRSPYNRGQPYYTLGDVLKEIIRDCEWGKIPKMILAVDHEFHRIKKINFNAVSELPRLDDLGSGISRCRPPNHFFDKYKNEN